ncbi:MAG: hypothetical protein IPF78_03755 [Flavobacteriales bacterium]|nr:hypothetical protein [Flavobacteriales bacterium]
MTPYLAFIDTANGDVLNSHLYGVPHYSTTLFAAKQFSNSDIILAGVSYSEGPQQGLLIRTTSDGDSLWMRNYFYYDADVEEGQGRFFDVLPTADNGCIAAGVAYNPVNAPYPPGHSQDTWVVKVDSMGCVVPGCDGITGITEQVTNLTSALHLYPNPVHGLLHVGIELPPKLTTSGPLTLTVTSLSGRVVLQEQVPSSAPDEVELDVGHFAAGTYALHLSDAHTWLAGRNSWWSKAHPMSSAVSRSMFIRSELSHAAPTALLEWEGIDTVHPNHPVGGNAVTRKMSKKSIGWEASGPPSRVMPGMTARSDASVGRVWINDEKHFDGVPEAARNFYIGGYQPAQKWLKDRHGRTLTFDDLRHYQRIIVALTEMGKVMEEVDSAGVV